MTRRWVVASSRIAVTAAAAMACWGGWPSGVRASERVTFSLRNTSPVPVSEAVFQSVPAGTIVPPVTGTDPSGKPIEGSPLASLPSSSGVDLGHAFTLLLSDPSTGGQPRDFLSLIFGFNPNPAYTDASGPEVLPFLPALDGQGNQVGRLDPGGNFDFTLNLLDAASASLIVPTTSGLALSVVNATPTPTPIPTPTPTPTPTPNPTPIPEPSALVLWSLIGGAAVAFARRRLGAVSPT